MLVQGLRLLRSQRPRQHIPVCDSARSSSGSSLVFTPNRLSAIATSASDLWKRCVTGRVRMSVT